LSNGALGEPRRAPTCTVENAIVWHDETVVPKIPPSSRMNVDDSRRRPMCLHGEGVGCKVVVGHGSDGRPRHGLRVKSTLESDENFEQNLLESQFFGAKN
jgi:hypothetical protein